MQKQLMESTQSECNERLQNAKLSESEGMRVINEQLDAKNAKLHECELIIEQIRLEIARLEPKLDKKRQSISLIKQQSEQTNQELREKDELIHTLRERHEKQVTQGRLLIEQLQGQVSSLESELT